MTFKIFRFMEKVNKKVYLIFDEVGILRAVCGSLEKANSIKRYLQCLFSEEDEMGLNITVFEVL